MTPRRSKTGTYGAATTAQQYARRVANLEDEILTYVTRQWFPQSLDDLTMWFVAASTYDIESALNSLTDNNDLTKEYHPVRQCDTWRPTGRAFNGLPERDG